jgi:hypothetical protein
MALEACFSRMEYHFNPPSLESLLDPYSACTAETLAFDKPVSMFVERWRARSSVERRKGCVEND